MFLFLNLFNAYLILSIFSLFFYHLLFSRTLSFFFLPDGGKWQYPLNLRQSLLLCNALLAILFFVFFTWKLCGVEDIVWEVLELLWVIFCFLSVVIFSYFGIIGKEKEDFHGFILKELKLIIFAFIFFFLFQFLFIILQIFVSSFFTVALRILGLICQIIMLSIVCYGYTAKVKRKISEKKEKGSCVGENEENGKKKKKEKFMHRIGTNTKVSSVKSRSSKNPRSPSISRSNSSSLSRHKKQTTLTSISTRWSIPLKPPANLELNETQGNVNETPLGKNEFDVTIESKPAGVKLKFRDGPDMDGLIVDAVKPNCKVESQGVKPGDDVSWMPAGHALEMFREAECPFKVRFETPKEVASVKETPRIQVITPIEEDINNMHHSASPSISDYLCNAREIADSFNFNDGSKRLGIPSASPAVNSDDYLRFRPSQKERKTQKSMDLSGGFLGGNALTVSDIYDRISPPSQREE